MDANDIARLSSEAMWNNDDASKSLDIEIQTVTPGHAVLTMPVTRRHTNGHDICHGGFIFTLADSAFAFACNSYNQVTVAQHNAITYIAPGKLGDTLTATASEAYKGKRSGIYDVVVCNQHSETIALFRGNSRQISGNVFNIDEVKNT